MKPSFKLAAVALLSAGVAAWLGAQALSPASKPAMDLMPSGALIYLEARNFNRLLNDWNASPERKGWLDSQNYQVFLRSHLVLRMTETRKAYLEAAGLPADAPFLDAIVGGESAIALYGIDKVEFLYTTKLNAGQFAGSALAGARSRFETRKAGDYNYFVRTRDNSAVAYALVNDRLFLGTREDLIAGALKLLSGQPAGQLSKEAWFVDALAKSPASSTAPDVKWIADLAHVAKTPQFRSYWIQRNITELSGYASSIANITIANGSIREERAVLRQQPPQQQLSTSSNIASLLPFAPAEAGYYEAAAQVTPDTVSALLKDRLFASAPSLNSGRAAIAPSAPASGEIGGEGEFDTRVDLPVQTASSGEDPFAPLSGIADNTDALLHNGAARLESDQVMVGIATAVVLHGRNPWNLAEVQRGLGKVAQSLWSVNRWNGTELAGTIPLSVQVQGNVLILSTSPQWMNRVLEAGRSAVTQATPEHYIAQYRHAQELPLFERLTRLLDFPSIPQGTDSREPVFFSENIASLARAFARLDSITITARDTPAAVLQTAVYKFK
jgi:hypothetical protein